MRDMQQVTGFFRAAYTVAAVIYGLYVTSLIVRARRATRMRETTRPS